MKFLIATEAIERLPFNTVFNCHRRETLIWHKPIWAAAAVVLEIRVSLSLRPTA